MSVLITNSLVANLAAIEVPEPLFRQLRRADDFIRLGVVAAYDVLQQKGGIRSDGERTGLFLGTAFGPMQTNFDVLDQVVENEPVSPTLFSHSVFNAAAGYVASVLGIHGCAITLTEFGFPFFRVLEQGMVAIESGRLDSCLILQIETYSELLLDAKKKLHPAGEKWHPGVVCWLLEKQDMGRGLLLEGLAITSRAVDGKATLQLQEQVKIDGKQIDTKAGFLGAASCLSRELDNLNPLPVSTVEIESEYGTVAMNIQGV